MGLSADYNLLDSTKSTALALCVGSPSSAALVDLKGIYGGLAKIYILFLCTPARRGLSSWLRERVMHLILKLDFLVPSKSSTTICSST
jgi:hypothetical protein